MRRFSFLGVCRFLLVRFSRRKLAVEGICNRCGNCCRQIHLRGPNGWFSDVETFRASVTNHPEYDRFEITGKDQHGNFLFSCTSLENSGLCKDYENRPAICRTFPSKQLYLQGGRLPEGCGFRFVLIKPFAPVLQRVLEKQGK